MSTPKTTSNATIPSGFTAAPGFNDDEPITLWQHEGIDVHGTLSIGMYWEPGSGFSYTLDVTDRSRGYSLADLKAAHSEIDQFIRRAKQIEGI